MKSEPSSDVGDSEKAPELPDRRLFLRSIGKWSSAAIAAAAFGGALFSAAPESEAQVWVNGWGPRRRRGRWINRWGPRGRWINRWGPRRGGWVNWW
jgi:hypothetical protein